MGGSDSLSETDVNGLLRVAKSQSESAPTERVSQRDLGPQPDTMRHNEAQAHLRGRSICQHAGVKQCQLLPTVI